MGFHLCSDSLIRVYSESAFYTSLVALFLYIPRHWNLANQLLASGNESSMSRIVYQRYKELCEFQDREPRTARRMRSFLSDFEILNLTLSEMEHRGQDGGTYRQHELNRDIATVVDAFQTIVSEFGAQQSIVEYFPDSEEEFATI